MTTIYEQLEAECLPLIERHHNDLTVIDRQCIEANPGVPFLHWTRSCGTTIVFLPSHTDTDAYPPYGVRVKYLFGTADREHILKEKVGMAEYHTRPANSPEGYSCRYYDGTRMRCLSVQKAVEVAKAYAKPIEAQWHSDWLRNNRPWEYRAKRDAGQLATA